MEDKHPKHPLGEQKEELSELEKQIEKARAELAMLYEISAAMRTTLKLDEILYIILTSVTSHEGLGFNRAMLFLVNEKKSLLEGRMGIGPDTGEEADRIWKLIEVNRMGLEDLISAYMDFVRKDQSRLNHLVKSLRIPLKEDAGILAQTALEEMGFEITTHEALQKVNDDILRLLKLEFFVTVPLKAKDKVVGVIVADNLFTKKQITKDDIRILTMFANQAGLAIENSKLYEQSLLMSHTDSLTRLYNHGYFQDQLAEEINKAKETKKPLSLVLLDLDNFKALNDSLGHQFGDKVLSEVSQILKDTSRENDIVARYGGEEFAIILLEVNKANARERGERLREAIEQRNLSVEGKKVTVSVGIAALGEDAETKNELIYKADRALYEAKSRGKNQTCLYSPFLSQEIPPK
jgi:diguanylate cyclase (GGDEF)-like protein